MTVSNSDIYNLSVSAGDSAPYSAPDADTFTQMTIQLEDINNQLSTISNQNQEFSVAIMVFLGILVGMVFMSSFDKK